MKPFFYLFSLSVFVLFSNTTIAKEYYIHPKFGKDEVKTANGLQKYGWGIRIINETENAIVENCIIENCTINNVSHTGLKLTGKNRNIKNIKILLKP